MRILCVGGGSGGHVTPIVAVVERLRNCHSGLDPETSDVDNSTSFPDPNVFRAEKLSSQIRNQISTGSSNPNLNHENFSGKTEGLIKEVESPSPLDIRVWVDKNFAPQTRDLLGKKTHVDVIASGKLRRYANLTWRHRWLSWYHLMRTHLPNLIDFFKIIGGFFQSFFKLIFWRPDVVFAKGGYVCLPVGIAATLLRIPLVIHDSDSVPGLTNRILARWATAIGTGSPVENYPSYPKKITKFIGIPVRPEIRQLNDKEKQTIKKQLSLDPEKRTIFVTGGGGGAQIFVDVFKQIASEILEAKTQIVLQTGKGRSFTPDKNLRADFFVHEFIVDEYASLMNVSDILVTRAGVTSLAEAAVVTVPTIIVPSPYLSGDHQTKNAAVYGKADAAVVLEQFDLEKDPEILLAKISEILNEEKLRESLRQNIAKFAKPDALQKMTEMILVAAKKN